MLDRPQIAAPAPVRAGEEGAVHHVVAALGHLLGGEQHVVLRGAVVGHEVQVAVVDVDQLVLTARDVGHVHVVGRGLVKMSTATRLVLAWPCLPVLEVDMSTILQGRPLITT